MGNKNRRKLQDDSAAEQQEEKSQDEQVEDELNGIEDRKQAERPAVDATMEPPPPPHVANAQPQYVEPVQTPQPVVATPPQYTTPEPPVEAQQLQQSPQVRDLLYSLLNQQKATGQHYYMVVVPEDDKPRVQEFDEVRDLVEALKEMQNKNTAVFPFLGYYMQISKGPYRYMRTPLGQMLPLFSIPEADELEFEEHGWLGDSQNEDLPPRREMPNLSDDQPDSDSPADDDDTSPFWDTSDS